MELQQDKTHVLFLHGHCIPFCCLNRVTTHTCPPPYGPKHCFLLPPLPSYSSPAATPQSAFLLGKCLAAAVLPACACCLQNHVAASRTGKRRSLQGHCLRVRSRRGDQPQVMVIVSVVQTKTCTRLE